MNNDSIVNSIEENESPSGLEVISKTHFGSVGIGTIDAAHYDKGYDEKATIKLNMDEARLVGYS